MVSSDSISSCFESGDSDKTDSKRCRPDNKHPEVSLDNEIHSQVDMSNFTRDNECDEEGFGWSRSEVYTVGGGNDQESSSWYLHLSEELNNNQQTSVDKLHVKGLTPPDESYLSLSTSTLNDSDADNQGNIGFPLKVNEDQNTPDMFAVSEEFKPSESDLHEFLDIKTEAISGLQGEILQHQPCSQTIREECDSYTDSKTELQEFLNIKQETSDHHTRSEEAMSGLQYDILQLQTCSQAIPEEYGSFTDHKNELREFLNINPDSSDQPASTEDTKTAIFEKHSCSQEIVEGHYSFKDSESRSMLDEVQQVDDNSQALQRSQDPCEDIPQDCREQQDEEWSSQELCQVSQRLELRKKQVKRLIMTVIRKRQMADETLEAFKKRLRRL